MKLSYEKVTTYHVEVTACEFVENHLKEIHKHPIYAGRDIVGYEFDFLIKSSSNGFLRRAFTLKESFFDMPEIELFNNRDKKLKEHLIERLEQIWDSIP